MANLLILLVAWSGIEPPTQGFSVLEKYCLTLLKIVDTINTNQHIEPIALDNSTAGVLIEIDLNSQNRLTSALTSWPM